MEKYVEQYQAWGGGLTLPTWTDVEEWQEGHFSITEVPGIPLPAWCRKILLPAQHHTETEKFPLVRG